MKKISSEKAKLIVGGVSPHYHWVCTVNNFWSKRYDTQAGARNALEKHWANYPGHRSRTYITTCTGNCS